MLTSSINAKQTALVLVLVVVFCSSIFVSLHCVACLASTVPRSLCCTLYSVDDPQQLYCYFLPVLFRCSFQAVAAAAVVAVAKSIVLGWLSPSLVIRWHLLQERLRCRLETPEAKTSGPGPNIEVIDFDVISAIN